MGTAFSRSFTELLPRGGSSISRVSVRQRPVKAAEMDVRIEFFVDQRRQLANARPTMDRAIVLCKVQHLGGNLVGTLWAAAPWNQGL